LVGNLTKWQAHKWKFDEMTVSKQQVGAMASQQNGKMAR
jgi:hypothetical protein